MWIWSNWYIVNFQFDIRGDPYGVLAAHPLAPLLSLHRIDAVEPIFPNQSHLDAVTSLIQAYRVDPPRILQQSVCYDRRRKWTVSISWGYTLQLYPSMVSALELKMPLQTFKTWRSWTDGPFTFNTRPVSSNPCEKPITYFLEHVKDGKSGNTLTTYKRFAGHEEKKCNTTNYAQAMALQRIVVLSKKMDPHYWTKVTSPMHLWYKNHCSYFSTHFGPIHNVIDRTTYIRLLLLFPNMHDNVS